MEVNTKLLRMFKEAIKTLDAFPKDNAYLYFTQFNRDGDQYLEGVVLRDWPVGESRTQRFKYIEGARRITFDRSIMDWTETPKQDKD